MPTLRAGKETEQNSIRFKNMLRKAGKKLSELDLSEELEKMMDLANNIQSDYEFWQHQSDGLAVFITKKVFYYYRLPILFDELVVVSDRFHLKPLIPYSIDDNKFYILALSQNDVRFFEAAKQSIHQVELKNVPTSLSESLKFHDPEKELQFHTTGGRGKKDQAAIYHGTGAGDRDKDKDILKFFRDINEGVTKILTNQNNPLVLACVEYLFPIYQEANNYSFLCDEAVTGSPDNLSPEELHGKAWTIVESLFQESKNYAFEKYSELIAKKSKLASSNLDDIVLASYEGRVDTLIITIDIQIWGQFHDESGQIKIHDKQEPGDEDLMDLASVYTILNGGRVYSQKLDDMQLKVEIAAIFRY